MSDRYLQRPSSLHQCWIRWLTNLEHSHNSKVYEEYVAKEITTCQITHEGRNKSLFIIGNLKTYHQQQKYYQDNDIQENTFFF